VLYSFFILKTFVIIFPSSNSVINGDLIRDKFEHRHEITKNAWVIGGDYTTSYDVGEVLGVSNGHKGEDVVFVLKLGSDYSGYYYADLWNKLKAWNE